MTINIKLEVGQWVEMNNGERFKVSARVGSFFRIDGMWFRRDGVHESGSNALFVARILPHIKLPNGDVLFEGDFAKTKHGCLVGPLEHGDGPAGYPWSETSRGWGWWNQNGKHQILGSLSLIARADPPEAETVTDSSGCVLCDLGVCEADEPKLLRDMTAEEVVALVEADKAGETIQCFSAVNWYDCREFVMDLDCAYRIKPAEPVRETVALYGADVGYGWEFDEVSGDNLTRITLPLIDGKMPTGTFTNEDGETIVVEELE